MNSKLPEGRSRRVYTSGLERLSPGSDRQAPGMPTDIMRARHLVSTAFFASDMTERTRHCMPETASTQAVQKSRSTGDGPCRHLSGARYHRYRCSLPGLAGFAADRRGETDTSRHGTMRLSWKADGLAAERRRTIAKDVQGGQEEVNSGWRLGNGAEQAEVRRRLSRRVVGHSLRTRFTFAARRTFLLIPCPDTAPRPARESRVPAAACRSARKHRWACHRADTSSRRCAASAA